MSVSAPPLLRRTPLRVTSAVATLRSSASAPPLLRRTPLRVTSAVATLRWVGRVTRLTSARTPRHLAMPVAERPLHPWLEQRAQHLWDAGLR